MKPRVFVGMSGGVDSSTTAALLVEQGYDVVGVYMKNWTEDVIGFACPWRQDLADAAGVAAKLGIPLKIYDFQQEYKQRVVDYMVREYRAGNTPNPDIMCNQEVKFKLFLETALADGAELIATGHYARILTLQGPALLRSLVKPSLQGLSLQKSLQADRRCGLFAGVDAEKDQSYFLARVSQEALRQVLMPLGDMTKDEVRALARKFGLPVADKPDSQGICFIGEVSIKDFLAQYIKPKQGAIRTSDGTKVGTHDGAAYYTIGQRHGLRIGGRHLPAGSQGRPHYVISKDMRTNTIYVTDNPYDPKLHYEQFNITNLHWINSEPDLSQQYQVRTRYRGQLHDCVLRQNKDGTIKVMLDGSERAITPGQSAVIYDKEQVLGGGIIV